MVPVSQLVLPVGVTGLTVKGKTPTPEPRSIIMGRSRPGSESVMKTHRVRVFAFACLFVLYNTVEHHTQIQRMELVQPTCTFDTSSVGEVGRFEQPAKKLSHLKVL